MLTPCSMFPCLSSFESSHRCLYHCVASARFFVGITWAGVVVCLFLFFVEAMAYEALHNECQVSDDEVA